MPTYDYECGGCGHTFELFQSISEAVKRKCPDCGRLKLRRLIGCGAAVVFKGSGFYQTDYRSDSYNKAAAADKPAAEGAGESKSGQAKSGETKSGESKSGESKSGEAKAGESKSAANKAPSKKSDSSKND